MRSKACDLASLLSHGAKGIHCTRFFLYVAAVLFSASDRDLVTCHAAPPAVINNINNRLQTEQLDVLGSLLSAFCPEAGLFRLQSANVDDT